MTPFGRFVRNFREDKGISLRQCAKSLGVSASYWCDVESGKKPAINDLGKLKKISEMFNLTECDFELLCDLVAEDRHELPPDVTAKLMSDKGEIERIRRL